MLLTVKGELSKLPHLVVSGACMVAEGLKSATYTETGNKSLLVEDQWEALNKLVLPGPRIISKDQPKRHVDNRNLETYLSAHAGVKVAELSKNAFVQFDDRVRLRLAAKEYLLHPDR